LTDKTSRAGVIVRVVVSGLLLALLAGGSYQLFRLTRAAFYSWMGSERLRVVAFDRAYYYSKKSLGSGISRSEFYYNYAESLYGIAKESENQAVMRAFMQQAKEAYEKAAGLNPLEGNVWLGLAQSSWWLSRLKARGQEAAEVEPLFLRALSLDPASAVQLYAVVSYYLSSGQIEKSLPYVERLAVALPYSYVFISHHPQWSKVVREHFREGLKSPAARRLNERQALPLVAQMAAEDKDWAQAAESMTKLIDRFGAAAGNYAYINLGAYYLKLDKQDEAKNAFLEGLRLSGDRAGVLTNLIWQQRDEADTGFFEEIARQTAEFDERVRIRLSLILGKAYLLAGDLDAAEQAFRRSLQDRETAEAHGKLAEIALKKKDLDTAELESQRATVLEPEEYFYYYQLAWSLQLQNKNEAALEAMSQAIKYSKGQRAFVFYDQGLIYWKLGKRPEAVQAFETASRLDPNNVTYLVEIARAYQEGKNYEKAERYWLAALKLNPAEPRLRAALTEIRRLRNLSESGFGKRN